jgi:hypothetical protein
MPRTRTGRDDPMIGTDVSREHESGISDEELCAQALAADPDAPVPSDAVPFGAHTGTDPEGPLPAWYMPAASGGLLTGWRRLPPALVVGSLVVINAFGLCITYGKLGW